MRRADLLLRSAVIRHRSGSHAQILLVVAAWHHLSLKRRANATDHGVRFEITADPQAVPKPADGRMFVIIGRNAEREPRLSIGRTGMDASRCSARTSRRSARLGRETIDERAAIFPIAHLSKLPPGDYGVQAVFDTNIDLKSPNAPGNALLGGRQGDDRSGKAVHGRAEADQAVPDETLPADTEFLRFIKLESKLLSAFHGRPIFLRAGVAAAARLGEGDDAQVSASRAHRRLRLAVHRGAGTDPRRIRVRQSSGAIRHAADDPAAPRRRRAARGSVPGQLGQPRPVRRRDHAGADSVRRADVSRHRQAARARLDGGSTGGWVSLALQVFYPDFFNGAWSYCPDGVDFRAFQLVNIYDDDNAYTNRSGFERPSARELNGEVRFTMRHECQLENVLGAATAGRCRGCSGARGTRPTARGAPMAGRSRSGIRRRARSTSRCMEHWKKYDLRLVLEQNWAALGPKLRGKIHIWVGEADNYFLNNAVHLLEDSLKKLSPPYEWYIVYGPGKGHCWKGATEKEIIEQMAARTGR